MKHHFSRYNKSKYAGMLPNVKAGKACFTSKLYPTF